MSATMLQKLVFRSVPDPGKLADTIARPSEDHWAMLAFTRFLLSLIVYFGHLGGTIGENDFTHAWREFGELAAVIGFFIISGFSIANSIEQRPQRYILRRIWRIWPTYLFSFFICTVPTALILPHYTAAYPANQPVTGGLVVGNLFMLQGLFLPVLEANAATWTLAIEEWFYLAAPLFRRCGSGVLGVVIIVSAYYYTHASSRFGWNRFASETGAVSHLCFILAWLLGFFFYRHRTSVWAHLVLFILPVWLISQANELGGKYSVITILAMTLVIAFGGKVTALLRLPHHIREGFIFLGNVSFPLYIVHYPIFFLIFALTKSTNHFAYAVAVFLLCVAVYFLMDKPNRKRWQPKGASS